MAGVLPFGVTMTKRMTMGYCTATLAEQAAHMLRLPEGTSCRGHVYHFSQIVVDAAADLCVPPAYHLRMERTGAEAAPAGVVRHGNTLASYVHLHWGSCPALAEALVAAARRRMTIASLLPSGTEIVCAVLSEDERFVRGMGRGVSRVLPALGVTPAGAGHGTVGVTFCLGLVLQ